MNESIEYLKYWIEQIAIAIEAESELHIQSNLSFLQSPELVLALIDFLAVLNEDEIDSVRAYYSACIYGVDLAVMQLQSAQENGNKQATKTLAQLMHHLALAIQNGPQTLGFWLPILNAFYEVHLDLSPELQEAYLASAEKEDEWIPEDETDHLSTMREMIAEMSDMSVFDIAENLFVQSYAMPADFFADLVVDLCSLEEGLDIAILTLLHPKEDVRAVVVIMLDQLLEMVTISSVSLTRLQAIKHWYPEQYHSQFEHWIKLQRKKGTVFHANTKTVRVEIKASEVDGVGAQGFYVHVHQRSAHRLSGILVKAGSGIKDAWVTPPMPLNEVKRYVDAGTSEAVSLREVDITYFTQIMNHFLAITLQHGEMPNLHLLELQELLHVSLRPEMIEPNELLEALSVQIVPFTEEAMQESFKRSAGWSKTKQFTESWYLENANIDKWVNRCSTLVDGVRTCDAQAAFDEVFEHELEEHRDKWLFHFLWMTLWAESKSKKNEKIGLDCLFIAYAIAHGQPLKTIPIMQDICKQSVINSIETMHERRTHLSKE